MTLEAWASASHGDPVAAGTWILNNKGDAACIAARDQHEIGIEFAAHAASAAEVLGVNVGAPVVVIKDYATGGDPSRGKGMNPEHTANSPTWMLDNWIYSANSSWRIRRIDGEWKKLPAITRGQWGLTQDNFGRMFFNSNSDHLRTDTLPAEYLVRNPFYRSATLSVQPLKDQSVWPSRVNPGVNRGYQEKQLKPGRHSSPPWTGP